MKDNATLDILKKNPELFLFQAGYLTFANYETGNPLKIANKEVLSSLTKTIFKTQEIRTQFTIEEFEAFLNQTKDFFDLAVIKNKEVLATQLNKIRDNLKNFFADSINEVKTKFDQKINENTHEKKLTDDFFFFLNNLDWKNWAMAYQAEIFNQLDKNKRPHFIFSNPTEETEIIVEFMKSDWEKVIERNYQGKIKMKTKKIVVIYHMFKNFEEVERFGVKCYQRENGKLMSVFDGCSLGA